MATMACQVAGSADHLHLAAIRCQTRLVEAILDHDASLVNRDLHFGRTALFFIIESGYPVAWTLSPAACVNLTREMVGYARMRRRARTLSRT